MGDRYISAHDRLHQIYGIIDLQDKAVNNYSGSALIGSFTDGKMANLIVSLLNDWDASEKAKKEQENTKREKEKKIWEEARLIAEAKLQDDTKTV